MQGEILSHLGVTAEDGGCSWLGIKPLAPKDRNTITREFAGVFSDFPKELDLFDAIKNRKDVQNFTKMSLQSFATQEVSKFMTRNANAVRLAGTAYSRCLDLRQQVEL